MSNRFYGVSKLAAADRYGRLVGYCDLMMMRKEVSGHPTSGISVREETRLAIVSVLESNLLSPAH
jgi:hypothetical protein